MLCGPHTYLALQVKRLRQLYHALICKLLDTAHQQLSLSGLLQPILSQAGERMYTRERDANMTGLVNLLQILVGSSLQRGDHVLNGVRGTAVGGETEPWRLRTVRRKAAVTLLSRVAPPSVPL
jgi:hypothetical protein